MSAGVRTALRLNSVSKSYGEGPRRRVVLDDVDLEVASGEFCCIVGYSGSGKTTLISIMAGLVAPSSGRVWAAGREVRGPGRDRAVVFQNYSLLPWLSVEGNVDLAVRAVCKEKSAAERRERVQRYVEMVGLRPARDKRPGELSGGMRQRVALARALATEPEVLLMDEPLSALDALTRAKLQDELAEICARGRTTVVMITNDIDEALLLADRVIPLQPAPGAGFGPAFGIEIARPRIRAAMNDQPTFKRLRGAITDYLTGAPREQAVQADADEDTLPDLLPSPKSERPWVATAA